MIDLRLDDLHSPIYNYIVPGLVSWMVRDPAADGSCVRLFEMTRNQDTLITPHSHRFAFKCKVLQGEVNQILWYESGESGAGDAYMASAIHYEGKQGHYNKEKAGVRRCFSQSRVYKAGTHYGMQSDEIHSIIFAKGAVVLFDEYKTFTDKSIVLEPYVDDEVIPTLSTEAWMFRKGKR